ncbi:MAG TPA: heparan-alpha-glucosaminide N-acetyltransferase domain-containing protein [Gemmatirosa sp.]
MTLLSPPRSPVRAPARTVDLPRAPRTAPNVLPAVAAGGARVAAVDVLRGVVMVLMALDHTRDYFGNAAANPTDLATTTPALFFARWVTHVCAPTFFLLAGAGAALALGRRGRAGLSRFLLARGMWLVVLELTAMRFLLQFNGDYRLTVLTVLWALGWSMVALAGLMWLPTAGVVAVGAGMIALHNLADRVPSTAFGAFAPLWTVLHVPGFLVQTPRVTVFAAYPLVPWVGVMAVGYGLGRVLAWPAERRRPVLLRSGIALTVAFVALRALNVYGDPRPWATQRDALFTALSFVNTTKYPPSLLFLAMTLGPALLALWWLDARLDTASTRSPRPVRPLLAFGRVPLFYFVLHMTLIHALATVVCAVRYGGVHWMTESPSLDRYPVTQPPGWPMPLPAVYLVWAIVVVLAYPCCRWYAALKARHPAGWLSYL